MTDQVKIQPNNADDLPAYEAPELTVLDANQTLGGAVTMTGESDFGTGS